MWSEKVWLWEEWSCELVWGCMVGMCVMGENAWGCMDVWALG